MQSKRNTTPSRSFFQSAPAFIMVPRLMVIFSTAALLAIGLVMVYSASSITSFSESGDALSEGLKQVIFAVVGILLCVFIVIFVDGDMLRGRVGFAFWVLCMVLLVLTSLMGTIGLGAKRWLSLGPISVQPSEFAKIAFTIMGARIVCERNEGLIDSKGTLKKAAWALIAPLLFLLATQSDLGTTMICFVALIAVLWLGGVDTKVIGFILAALIVLGAVAVFMKSYRADRLSFLDPWSDPTDAGYQLIHSFKAFAAGGLFGSGIGNSYEKMLYLPEAETDFIFAIIGEELGLVGAVGVVVLFLVFLYGGLTIARQSSNDFSLTLVGGLTTMVVFQAFLNILCVIGFLPTTGKPLPFISSGGSSLISSLMIVGIILSASYSAHSENTYRQRRENLRIISSYGTSAPRNSYRAHSVYSRRTLSLNSWVQTSQSFLSLRGAFNSRIQKPSVARSSQGFTAPPIKVVNSKRR